MLHVGSESESLTFGSVENKYICNKSITCSSCLPLLVIRDKSHIEQTVLSCSNTVSYSVRIEMIQTKADIQESKTVIRNLEHDKYIQGDKGFSSIHFIPECK